MEHIRKATEQDVSRLAEILGSEQVTVNSLHHQAVDKIAPALIASATAEDGINEAVEHPDRKFCIGVQWHPEHTSSFSKPQRMLFRAFVNACKNK